MQDLQLFFLGYNTTRAKLENDDKDFNRTRIINEVRDVLQFKPFNKPQSILFANFGLHFTESSSFSNYKKLIQEFVGLVKNQSIYKGNVIWRTTTALNKHKLGGRQQHSRRFLTQQVSAFLLIVLLVKSLLTKISFSTSEQKQRQGGVRGGVGLSMIEFLIHQKRRTKVKYGMGFLAKSGSVLFTSLLFIAPLTSHLLHCGALKGVVSKERVYRKDVA